MDLTTRVSRADEIAEARFNLASMDNDILTTLKKEAQYLAAFYDIAIIKSSRLEVTVNSTFMATLLTFYSLLYSTSMNMKNGLSNSSESLNSFRIDFIEKMKYSIPLIDMVLVQIQKLVDEFKMEEGNERTLKIFNGQRVICAHLITSHKQKLKLVTGEWSQERFDLEAGKVNAEHLVWVEEFCPE